MSYAASAEMQRALYDLLTSDAAPAELAGVPVVDRMAEGTLPPLYIALGPERVRDGSTKTSRGAEHRLTITVISALGGFAQIKQIAGAICTHLEGQRPSLSQGQVAGLQFLSAQARRGPSGAERRLDLSFRAFVDDI
ncbi:MAG: DUF3168 domain-containing protein [Mangrovicoccus sp.]|nr:DUF3168 domain-containing protein [Mangrovicoccus sp.]